MKVNFKNKYMANLNVSLLDKNGNTSLSQSVIGQRYFHNCKC